jgi:mRNA interferase RelE/StbE
MGGIKQKESVKQKPVYLLAFGDKALVEWNALDGSVKTQLKKVLATRLVNPHVPSSALHGVLKGYYKIKLLKVGYRLIYRVIDDKLMVFVVAIGKRDADEIYEIASRRIKAGG